MLTFLVITAPLIVIGRFTVPSHGLSWPGSYEAIAHIWVGILFCMLYYEWNNTETFWCTAIILATTTIFETIMFFVWPKKVENGK